MKSCPRCSRQVEAGAWLCDCGYEFSSEEMPLSRSTEASEFGASPILIVASLVACFMVLAIPTFSPRPTPAAIIDPGPLIFLLFVALGGCFALPGFFYAVYWLIRRPSSLLLWLLLFLSAAFPAFAAYEISNPLYQRHSK